MKTYYKMLNDLEYNLKSLDQDKQNQLYTLKQSIHLCNLVLEKLHILVSQKDFNTLSEEIEFFKHIKPKISSWLIYHTILFSIISKQPRSSNEKQIRYFNEQIDKLQEFFNDNLEFYHYYKTKSADLDEHYFTRRKSNVLLHLGALSFYSDSNFSTSHDEKMATILAYEMLINYLKEQIAKLKNGNTMETNITAFQNQEKLFWTGNKVDLIELIYGLYCSGAINSGTAEIKDVALAFQQLFNIDLGDYYHTFIEMRSRKINPTKFTDKLKESLVEYIKDLDR